MAPVIVLLSGTWHIWSSGSLPWPLYMYHARESPLNLCCFSQNCGATLPEPGETVQFGVRGGMRNDYSSSNQDGGANGSSFGENGLAEWTAAASDPAASWARGWHWAKTERDRRKLDAIKGDLDSVKGIMDGWMNAMEESIAGLKSFHTGDTPPIWAACKETSPG